MAQTWFEDAVRWRGFLGSIIEGYRHATAPILRLLPFDVPSWVADYYIFGVIIGIAFFQASVFLFSRESMQKEFPGFLTDKIHVRIVWGCVLRVVGIGAVALVWPVYLVFAAVPAKWTTAVAADIPETRRMNLLFVSWIGAIVLAVCVLLAINATLQRSL
jgi:hypothetical protein